MTRGRAARFNDQDTTALVAHQPPAGPGALRCLSPITPRPPSPRTKRREGGEKITCGLGGHPPCPPSGLCPEPRGTRAPAARRAGGSVANPFTLRHQRPAGPGHGGVPHPSSFFSPFPKFGEGGRGVGDLLREPSVSEPRRRSRITPPETRFARTHRGCPQGRGHGGVPILFDANPKNNLDRETNLRYYFIV